MGIVVLEGGGPFVANDVLDRQVLGGLGGPIAILPTADAFENPDELIASAHNWANRLSLEVVICGVFTRADAREEHHARTVKSAKAVVLAGDSSIHLRSTLLNTPVWEAIEHQAESGIVVGVGNSAAALCDPMIDPRGGALGLGLGLVTMFTAIVESEQWQSERMLRTRQLAKGSVAIIPTGSAVVCRNQQWSVVGDAIIHSVDTQGN
jgi:cyanophycinase